MRGVFSRTLSLPADINAVRAAASFKDGVLERVMPGNEKTKRRNIRIS